MRHPLFNNDYLGTVFYVRKTILLVREKLILKSFQISAKICDFYSVKTDG